MVTGGGDARSKVNAFLAVDPFYGPLSVSIRKPAGARKLIKRRVWVFFSDAGFRVFDPYGAMIKIVERFIKFGLVRRD